MCITGTIIKSHAVNIFSLQATAVDRCAVAIPITNYFFVTYDVHIYLCMSAVYPFKGCTFRLNKFPF